MTVGTKQPIKSLSICVGSRVTIDHEDMRGVVRGVLMNIEGIQYNVSYWKDGTRKVEWCYADEITEGWSS